MASRQRVVVVGAGVTGLTTAYLLSKNPQLNISVAAKFMPGDLDIEYASPWAGANYLPLNGSSIPGQISNALRSITQRLASIFKAVLYTSKVENPTAVDSWHDELHKLDPWFKDLVPNFRQLPKEELRGYESGTAFTSVCINVAIYLPWLVSECLKAGVVFKRAVFSHIADAAAAHPSSHPAGVVVNCTGLSSRTLGGVEDAALTPARGQVVVVRNSACGKMPGSNSEDIENELTYIMERAAGGGTILGGCYQLGNWSALPDYNLATRIMQRAVDLYPELANGKGIKALDIIRHGVGLRPVRRGGTRVEREVVRGVQVVHSYGHGGFGYQSSYGCAKVVVGLVNEALGELVI